MPSSSKEKWTLRAASEFSTEAAYKEYLLSLTKRFECTEDDDDEIMEKCKGGVLESAFDDCDDELTRSILNDSRLIAQSNQLQLVSDMLRICPISAESVKPGGILASSAIETTTASGRSSDSESSTADSENKLEKGMSIVLGDRIPGELASYGVTARGHTADNGRPVAVPLRLGGFEETERMSENGVLELRNEALREKGGIRIKAEPFFEGFTETVSIPSDMPFSEMTAVPGLPEVAKTVARRSVRMRKKLLEPAAKEYVQAYGVWSKIAEARQRELLELSGVFGHKQTDLIRALDATVYNREDKKTFETRIRSQHYLLLGNHESFGGGCSIMNARSRGRHHPRMPEALKGTTSSSAKTEISSSDYDTPRNEGGGRRKRSSRGATAKESPAVEQQIEEEAVDEEAEKRASIPDLELFDYSLVGSSVAFNDTNRRVADLAEANKEYFLQLTQPTDADVKKFLERLVSFPKDFRRMAAGSDRLSTGQMIEIYFRYKNLLGCKTMLSGSLRSQTCKHIARKEIKRTMYYLSKAADKVPHLCPRAPPVGAHGRPSRYYTHEFLRCLEQNSLRYNPHRRRAIVNTEDDNSLRGKLEDILATAVASHCLEWADLEAVAQRRYRPSPFKGGEHLPQMSSSTTPSGNPV
ncbi:hypothetical protein Pmar_PMAR022289 [Perkinsus marinus ATCC 50983]|uniref:Uncharacterized protein n=1 Tax=Perkinsus marinus (strain ATCC 50983 / TXsc) TaxID=423536 RepID=C5KDP5_PERM5|nr:hypothetical protein Pmar_PMAR022289 [Perkinsus marinus ATCC 50983]EER17348.1 hypothetical protein Pmar_PMAR022289 [Perkinsus marinus ATCC 50983]|eukprot:XP_002785552.1 hypothetical protein Pmar_PMAR022289 [Perkinsus marinus ATCC 50983]